jgi:hypothetical protein
MQELLVITYFWLYLGTRDPVSKVINTYVFFQQTDMWLSNAKSSFFTKGILEAFDVIYEILGKIYLSWKNGNLICKITKVRSGYVMLGLFRLG